MNPKPLDQIRLRFGDHKAALWWLGLLYRRPRRFHRSLEEVPRGRRLAAGWRLWAHALPYVALLSFSGRFAVSAALGMPVVWGLAAGTFGGIAVGVAYFRLYYYAPHFLLVWPKPRGRRYRYHPVAWDDVCWLPFPHLDRLLVAHAEADAAAGEEEIERLIAEYPSQRVAAFRARVVLLARKG